MRKVLNAVKNVLVWLVVAFAVFIMIFTLISVNTFDRSERSFLGYKFFIVQTDSMSATDFNAGDIVMSKDVKDPTTLKVGDIITFISQNSHNEGEIVTHKIRSLTTDENGDPGFITYGTTTDTDDEAIVTYPYIVGKYQTKIPQVGSFFLFLKTTPGYLLCIFLPFVLILLSQGLNCVRLFRQYKKEQNAEIRAEREKLEEERKKTEQMMKELQEMMAKMSGGEVAEPQKEETEPTEKSDD